MKNNFLYLSIVFLIPITIWSAYSPKNYLLWVLEASPIWILILILLISYKRQKFTNMTYFFILIGATLMLIGAHYSYAAVPLGEWVKEALHLERNNYDKVGHFFQGFITTLIIKELILQQKLITSRKWVNFFAISFAVALSAIWEILEWLVVIILIYFGSKKPALEFLGAQGYVWDTQSDMFMATLGALIAVFILGKYHESLITKLPS